MSLKRHRAAAGFRDSPRRGQSLKSRQRVRLGAGEEAFDQGLSPKGDCPSSGTELQPVSGTVPGGTVPKSSQRVGFRAGEEAVDLVVQRAFVGDQLAGELAGAFE
jgi:hypothetical protein